MSIFPNVNPVSIIGEAEDMGVVFFGAVWVWIWVEFVNISLLTIGNSDTLFTL